MTTTSTSPRPVRTGTRLRRRVAAASSAALLGLGLATTLSACSGDPEVSVSAGPTADAAPDSGTSLAPADFAAALKRSGTTVLDVRTPAEFAEGHLEGAVNIDVEAPDFVARVAQLDPSTPYAVYCRSGNRSKTAMGFMTGNGFASVFDLDGGINAWTADGGDTVTG
ncbi:MAG: rhodanese-like domain-containing protein [Nocardioidaceae bacterium]